MIVNICASDVKVFSEKCNKFDGNLLTEERDWNWDPAEKKSLRGIDQNANDDIHQTSNSGFFHFCILCYPFGNFSWWTYWVVTAGSTMLQIRIIVLVIFRWLVESTKGNFQLGSTRSTLHVTICWKPTYVFPHLRLEVFGAVGHG